MLPLCSDDPHAIGPHRLLARLGSGGMGKVYLARTPHGHLAALKVVKEDLAHDHQFRARFAREVRTAQRVHGPFTPAVVDADPEAPAPWMATEYVPGPTLKEAVRANGPFPEPSLRVLTLGMARALHTIHTAGLMHRDLKPSNILLSPRGPQVIDFGIARAVEGTVLTRTGQTFGTPAYTSPEQITGREVGPASDVFSLAGVVVHAATGQPPFGHGKAAELLARVVSDQADLKGAPEHLRPLLERCLAKDPAERPTADEIVQTLSTEPLPSAEHGWLPAQVNQSIEAHHSHTRAALDATPPTTATGLAEAARTASEGTRAVPPHTRGRTALIAGSAALAVVTMIGTVGLLAASPWPDAAADDDPATEPPRTVPPAEPSRVFDDRVLGIAFAPHGESLYVSGVDHLVEVDWETGEELARFDDRPNDLTVGVDGTLVSAFANAVVLRGPDHGISLRLEDPDLRGWSRPVLSEDGTRMAVAVDDAEENTLVQLWDLDDEEVEFEVETDSIRRKLAFNADESLLLVSDYTGDGTSAVWDLTTQETVAEFPNEDFPPVPREGSDADPHMKHLTFHPTDPSVLAVSTGPEDTVLYDLDTGETTAFEAPETRGQELLELHFSPDGSQLVGSGSGSASFRGGRVWDTATGELLTEEGVPLYYLLDHHPQGGVIATVTPLADDENLLIVDAETFEVLHEYPH
ncbi:WD40 repeat domain-containing serine/threonine protein kinase [Nocardiopsis metallicus]|uniref:Protein kinase domain-containing protein n=1 Tax=Nocardiopsis metallicus TaxID=179819 RepID=A0A840W992_9ACTN|nr:serine/threonine-protein kinase [Nocardiopsis metallicus]MBB5493579.1 hypothetical protein [Nocardiopsis metallicus]